METIRKITAFLEEWKRFVAAVGATLVFIGYILYKVHTYYMMPVYVVPTLENFVATSDKVDSIVSAKAYKMYRDSAKVWGDRMLARAPGGLGGFVVDAMGVENKKQASDSIAWTFRIVKAEEMRWDYIMGSVRYMYGLNSTLMNMCTMPYVYKGVKLRKTPENDNGKYSVFWRHPDTGKWWRCMYDSDLDMYYVVPDNTMGEPVICY